MSQEILNLYPKDVRFFQIPIHSSLSSFSKILEFLSHEEIRESACECLQEIVNKGIFSFWVFQ